MGVVSRAESIISLIPRGIIALESALSFYDLCTFSNDYVIFLNNNFTINNNQFIRFYPNILGNDDIVDFDGRLSITTPERTICEMIINDRRDDFILEALECCLYDNNPSSRINNLIEVSKKYNVYDQLMSYIEEIES